MRASIIFCCALLISIAAHAVTIETPLPDASQERTARALFTELRCVVCEGQSVADSDAVLAAQMRAQVREQVAAGKSRAEILAFFRERYGEHILMTPPLNPSTILLWFAPLILILFGIVALRRVTTTKEPS